MAVAKNKTQNTGSSDSDEGSKPRIEELIIYVENENIEKFLPKFLPKELRKISRIIEIGPASLIARQLSACYRESRENCICVLFGDIQENLEDFISKLVKDTERQGKDEVKKIRDWGKVRIFCLTSNSIPENWFLEQIQQIANSVDPRYFLDIFEYFELDKIRELKNILHSIKTNIKSDTSIRQIATFKNFTEIAKSGFVPERPERFLHKEEYSTIHIPFRSTLN